ncbi:MAG: dihydrolipoamide acetyltransferase family protein [Chthoniobacterales bacterium]|jgi:pyruvate dehydrogenase E2 component (dihydrolipoamide acetyltransferase)
MPAVTMPKLSDTMLEGTLVKWRKAKGDKVEVGDILAEIETDKATMEMESFDDGTITDLCAKEGEIIKVGDKIAMILAEGETAEAAPSKPATEVGKSAAKLADTPLAVPAKTPFPTTKPSAAAILSGRVKASPLARKIAAANGVNLAILTGSGPGGRVVRKDVENAPRGGGVAPSSTPVIRAAHGIAGEEKNISLTGMRKTIAERLLASKTQIPHFYLSVSMDGGPLMDLRNELNTMAEKDGRQKLTVNDFILLAAARAAAEVPKINAAYDGDSIVEYADVNLAVAVAIDDGLITPVIRKASTLTLREISAQMKDLAAKARGKKLKPDEYQGGTITLSSLGGFGIDDFLPIINPPQAFILGVGAITKQPVVNQQDQIVVGHRLVISGSGDHRVVDGAVAAEYMNALRRYVEKPALLLL